GGLLGVDHVLQPPALHLALVLVVHVFGARRLLARGREAQQLGDRVVDRGVPGVELLDEVRRAAEGGAAKEMRRVLDVPGRHVVLRYWSVPCTQQAWFGQSSGAGPVAASPRIHRRTISTRLSATGDPTNGMPLP